MVTGNSPTQQPAQPWPQGRVSRREAFTRSNQRAVFSNSVEGRRSVSDTLVFVGDRHIHDEFPFGREETLLVDLDDSVALLLIKFEDPPVEIIAFVRHIFLSHTR